MSMLTTIIALCACLAIAARLLLFRRGTRRYQRRWAVMAWLLINVCVIGAVRMLFALAHEQPVPWPVAMLLVLAAWQVFRARGNAAELWRLRP